MTRFDPNANATALLGGIHTGISLAEERRRAQRDALINALEQEHAQQQQVVFQQQQSEAQAARQFDAARYESIIGKPQTTGTESDFFAPTDAQHQQQVATFAAQPAPARQHYLDTAQYDDANLNLDAAQFDALHGTGPQTMGAPIHPAVQQHYQNAIQDEIDVRNRRRGVQKWLQEHFPTQPDIRHAALEEWDQRNLASGSMSDQQVMAIKNGEPINITPYHEAMAASGANPAQAQQVLGASPGTPTPIDRETFLRASPEARKQYLAGVQAQARQERTLAARHKTLADMDPEELQVAVENLNSGDPERVAGGQAALAPYLNRIQSVHQNPYQGVSDELMAKVNAGDPAAQAEFMRVTGKAPPRPRTRAGGPPAFQIEPEEFSREFPALSKSGDFFVRAYNSGAMTVNQLRVLDEQRGRNPKAPKIEADLGYREILNHLADTDKQLAQRHQDEQRWVQSKTPEGKQRLEDARRDIYALEDERRGLTDQRDKYMEEFQQRTGPATGPQQASPSPRGSGVPQGPPVSSQPPTGAGAGGSTASSTTPAPAPVVDPAKSQAALLQAVKELGQPTTPEARAAVKARAKQILGVQ